jgi:glutamine synthetase
LQTLEPRSDGKQWDVDTLPIWNFDGSSTGQAPGENSDVYLRPCAVYPDPFRKGTNILYVAETQIYSERTPLTTPSVS